MDDIWNYVVANYGPNIAIFVINFVLIFYVIRLVSR